MRTKGNRPPTRTGLVYSSSSTFGSLAVTELQAWQRNNVSKRSAILVEENDLSEPHWRDAEA